MRWNIVVIFMVICFFSVSLAFAQKGEVLEKGKNRLHNGDFEEGLLEPWKLEVRQDLGAGAEIEIDKTTSASGKRSAKVIVTVPTGTAWHVKLRQDDRCFEKEQKFTVKFWCKAEKPRNIEASLQLQHDPWTVFFSQKFSVDTEWKEYSLMFIPSVDNFQDHWFAFHVADSNIPVWFDNVRYFLGEPKDEEGFTPKQAVEPKGNLVTTSWALMKVM